MVYYGDEQYLHNDTSGGNDPYDRNAMTSFGMTDAVTLIQYLAALRAFQCRDRLWNNAAALDQRRCLYL